MNTILLKITFVFFVLTGIFYATEIRECWADAIIVDHTCTNAELIPDSAIAAAVPLRFVMRFCSMGLAAFFNGNTSGPYLLYSQNSRYDYTNMKGSGRGHPGGPQVCADLPYFDVLVSTFTGPGFVANHLNEYDVFTTYLYFSEHWPNEEWDFAYYRDSMLYCEATWPTKKFVWCTTTVPTWAINGWTWETEYNEKKVFNENVRNYCRDNGKILYDWADISCHDPEGNKVVSSTVGSVMGFGSFELMYGPYTSDNLHPNTPLGALQLTKAYWWLMARIAGWQGLPIDTTPPIPPAVVRDGTSVTTDSGYTNSLTQLSANWDAATDAESGISGYKYAIGTGPGATDITNGWISNGTAKTVTKAGLTLTMGTTYYFSVKAINGAAAPIESASARNSNGQVGTDSFHATVYWKFDEGTGISVADNSGSGNTGVLNNSPAWTTGKTGGGIVLDGIDDNVTNSTLPPVKDNFTVCAWVKATTTHELDTESGQGWAGTSGQKYLFWPEDSGTNAGAGVSVGINGISVYEHGSGYMPPLAVYSGDLGTGWNHIAVVYESKKPKIYLNGALVRTGLISTRPEVYIPKTVGGGGYGMFPGTIDEVRIYPVSLTSQEVQVLFNSYITDTTSPTAPSVVSDGTGYDVDSTTFTTQLSANWTAATDAESGIANYQFAIGTTSGGTNVVPWAAIGNVLSVTKTGLSLTEGTTYYFNVRAVNGVGLTGNVANSDGQFIVIGSQMFLHYKFDDQNEIVQTTAFDYSGHNHNGGIIGPELSSDRATGNYSLYFDGLTDNVQVPGSTDFIPRKAITVACWVKIPDISGNYYPLYLENGYSLIASNSQDSYSYGEIKIGGNQYRLKGLQLEINKWQHLALTYDSTTGAILFYVNGSVAASSTTTSGLIDNSLYLLYLGRYQSSYLKGNIDDVRIYNYALSSGQVMSLYNEIIVDTTPPIGPATVWDGTSAGQDMDSTTSTTSLSANWDVATDSESEISNYQFTISTMLGGTNIVDWTDNGLNTSVTKTGLSLTVGTTYYFSVRVVSAGGTGPAAKSDGQYVGSQAIVASSEVVISDVEAINITEDSVTITWTTDKPAMSQVEYGLTTEYDTVILENTDLVTYHSLNLMNLTPGCAYHYRVKSRQNVGTTAVSGDFTFTTRPIPNKVPDTNAYPNPVDFSKGQTVKFRVHSLEFRDLEIYTLSGKLVKELRVESGAGDITWDGTNEDGEKVARGIYFYQIIRNNGDIITGKLAVK